MTAATRSQSYFVPGTYTFTAPTGVTAVWAARILGAGCGGGGVQSVGAGGDGGGGGGSGEQGERLLVPIGATATIVVGQGGLAGIAGDGTTVLDGGASSIDGIVIALGGATFGQPTATNMHWGGNGGGPGGGAGGNAGIAPLNGSLETPCFVGGHGGAQGNSTAPAAGSYGTLARSVSGNVGAASTREGGGGANSLYGAGGNGGNDSTASLPSQSGDNTQTPGCGGGGSSSSGTTTNLNGGQGGHGGVVLMWIA